MAPMAESDDDDSANLSGLTRLVGSSLGAYRIERLVGVGGMGAVFVGRHQQTGWERAIKVIRPEMAALDEFRRRFLEEAKILDSLNHPNILRVYELAEAPPHLYLVTELLAGSTVGERLRKAPGKLPVGDVVTWFGDALAGVAEAHRRRVLHRDLKPDNLFVTDEGQVKVLDFGIAKAADETARLTATSARVPGSPPYMAPELIQAMARPSERSDVYALGISLYEALVGMYPFGVLAGEGDTTGSALAMMYAHVHTPLPDPRAVRADIGEALAQVIRVACAKKPEERFADAEHMRLALAAAVTAGGGDTARGAAPVGMTRLELPSFAPASRTAPVVPLAKANARPRRWPIALVALPLVAGGGYFAWSRLAPKPAEPAPVATAPTPDMAAPARPNTEAQNPWVRIARPPSKVELGLSAGDRGGSVGLARAVDTFAGPDFDMQSHEVTWEEYLAWPDARSDPKRVPAPPDVPSDRARLPVSGVSYANALAYCEWLGGDLPTEAQWEFAARGAELRPHPWGSDPVDLDRLHAWAGANGAPVAVESSKQDVTPQGVHDLAGNAAEWTRTKYRMEHGDTPPWTERFRAVRGLPLRDGRPSSLPRYSATARWKGCAVDVCEPDDRAALAEVGFRCVREPLPVPGGDRK